tara:strand:- start:12 stop:587 length:576 start_codon:yes stop_codon:yes gene_type:complete
VQHTGQIKLNGKRNKLMGVVGKLNKLNVTLKKISELKKQIKDKKNVTAAKAEIKKLEAMLAVLLKKDSNESKAIGNTTNRLGTQQNKKEGVGSMVSYLSMSRGKAIAKAGQDLRAEKITQSEHDNIVDAIDKANESEVRPIQKPSKKPVTLSRMTTKEDRDLYKGGMAKAKPRTGNTDYRKGGMFMKSGKK